MSYVIETNLVRNFNVHLGCEPREIAYFSLTKCRITLWIAVGGLYSEFSR